MYFWRFIYPTQRRHSMPTTVPTRTPVVPAPKLTTEFRRLTRWERYYRMVYLINLGESILAEIRNPVTLDPGDDASILALSLEHAEADYLTALAHKRILVAKRLQCFLHDPLPSHRRKAHLALRTIMCMDILPFAITWRTAIAHAKCAS